MSLPPLPPIMDQLGNRHFSFYPPIINIEHNEWQFRRATWSEILVVNSSTGEEIWIPRRFVGEVSRIKDPVLIVGLVKELEYKARSRMAVSAARDRNADCRWRRLAQSPFRHAQRTGPGHRHTPANPVTDSHVGRLRRLLLVGVVACIVVVTMHRGGDAAASASYTPASDQTYLEARATMTITTRSFESSDRRGTDRWQSETGDDSVPRLSGIRSELTP